MTKYILAEEYINDFDYADSSVVALTAVASASFVLNNIDHTTIEDYSDEAEMRCHETQYFKDQLQWFQALDCFLKAKFDYCEKNNLNLASAYHNRFIYLLDFLVMRYYRVNQFLQKIKPKELCVISRSPGIEPAPDLEAFSRYDRWSYVPIIRLLAEKIEIPIEFIETSLYKQVTKPSSKIISGLVTSGFKRITKKIQFLANIQNFTFRLPDLGAVYIPEIGNFATQECFKALKTMKRKVLLRATFEGQIKKTKKLYLQKKLTTNSSGIDSREFETSSFLNWGNIQTDPALASLASPYVMYFIEKKVPLIIEEVKKLSVFFTKENVQVIIAHASVGSCTTALLAAKVLDLPRICFQHSVGVADSDSWLMDELNLFNYNYAMCTISKKYFTSRQLSISKSTCLVDESPDYLRFIKKRYSKPNPSRNNSKKIQLLYCPSKLATNGIAHFTTFYYPMSWYFKFQCNLLSFLSRIENCEIIYKHLDNQTWANQSIIPWLKTQSFSNITVVEGSLKDFFDSADRLLFDYPSSGFFEALASEKPVLALYHEAVKIWPAMLTEFKNSLQSYSSQTEAQEKVMKFIQSSGQEYQPHLELGGSDIKQNLKQTFDLINV